MGPEININTAKATVNRHADDINVFCDKMELYIPRFSKTFRAGIEAYGKAFSMYSASDYMDDKIPTSLKNDLSEIFGSFDVAIQGTEDYKNAIVRTLAMTSKLAKAKRRAISILDRYLNELLMAKKLTGDTIDAIESW